MRRMIAIARKEVIHILRDPRSLAVVILMPMFMLLIFGYAIDMDLKQLKVGVLDFDSSPSSRAFINEMVASGFIVESERLNLRDQVETGFQEGRFRAVLVIPSGYGESLIERSISPVQILIDGTDGTTAASVFNYLNSVAARLNRASAVQVLGDLRIPIESRTRVFFNPQLVSANFIVPGLVALLMMMICALLTSIAITREKETGTLEQILTTPVGSGQVIIGKVVPYMVIAAIDTALVLGLGRFVFKVPMNGSWWILAGYSLIYLLIALAFGIIISTIAKTQQVAMIGALMATLLPSLLLSGFIFPIASMPVVLQTISHLIPATYYLKIIRGIMLKGVGMFPLDGGILLGMAVVSLTAAVLRFQRRLD